MKLAREEQLPQAGDTSQPFFAGGGRQHTLNEIEQLLALPGRHVLVVGGVGVGKSALLDELSRRVADDLILCRLDGVEECDTTLLVRRLAQATGEVLLEASGIGELLEVLDHLALLGRRVLLVCDDARLLPPEILESLSSLAQGGSVHLLLATDTEGAGEVSAACPDIAFNHVKLEPFERQALERYIYFRLSCSGRDHIVLDTADLDAIDAATGGVPGAIDEQLARRAPAQEHLPAPERPGFPRRHVIGVGTIAVLVLMVWLLWPGPQRSDDDAGYVTRSLTLPTPGEPARVAVRRDQSYAQPQEASRVAGVRTPAVPDQPDGADPSSVAGETVFAPEAASAAGDAEAPVAVARKEPASTAAGGVAKSKAARAAAATPMATAVAPKSAASAPRRADAGDGYAVQLMGTRSRGGAERFVASHSGLDDLRYRETVLQGKPWYIVLAGNYSSLKEARTAAQRLPPALRKLKPWPREVPPEH